MIVHGSNAQKCNKICNMYYAFLSEWRTNGRENVANFAWKPYERKYNISLSRFRRYTCTFIKIFLKQDLDDEQSVFPGPWLQVANTANLPRNHCNWHDLPAAAAASREEARGRCAALLFQKKCIFSVFWLFFFATRCYGKEEYWF